ncbi:MAG: PilZ domain-containing protein [Candidatus Omnitrophica bacterium]|nr:PilZ domain-containing protein [Candidatus Omnitrophota bacterium]
MKNKKDRYGIVPIEERRRFIRHPVSFPLTYRVVDEKKLNGAKRSKTLNISKGGLLFMSEIPLKINSRIVAHMPFQNKVFDLPAKVVRCDRSDAHDMYNVGVCFMRGRDAFKAKVVEQLYRISEFRELWSLEVNRDISFEEASTEWIKRYSKQFRDIYW